MEVRFGTRKEARLFSSESEIRRKYGPKAGKTIMHRLAVIQAAECLEDIPTSAPFRRHELKGKRRGQFAVDPEQPHRLIFEPDHNPVPTKADGGLDLRRIQAVTILEVKDYH